MICTHVHALCVLIDVCDGNAGSDVAEETHQSEATVTKYADQSSHYIKRRTWQLGGNHVAVHHWITCCCKYKKTPF